MSRITSFLVRDNVRQKLLEMCTSTYFTRYFKMNQNCFLTRWWKGGSIIFGECNAFDGGRGEKGTSSAFTVTRVSINKQKITTVRATMGPCRLMVSIPLFAMVNYRKENERTNGSTLVFNVFPVYIVRARLKFNVFAISFDAKVLHTKRSLRETFYNSMDFKLPFSSRHFLFFFLYYIFISFF